MPRGSIWKSKEDQQKAILINISKSARPAQQVTKLLTEKADMISFQFPP